MLCFKHIQLFFIHNKELNTKDRENLLANFVSKDIKLDVKYNSFEFFDSV